jgi:hypothetical protein
MNAAERSLNYNRLQRRGLDDALYTGIPAALLGCPLRTDDAGK